MGHFIDFFKEDINKEINLEIIFDINIINNDEKIDYESKINNNNDDSLKFGIKTHYPQIFYNQWLIELLDEELSTVKSVKLNIKIKKVSQYILFNFDNYFGNIEFNIYNLKIIIS